MNLNLSPAEYFLVQYYNPPPFYLVNLQYPSCNHVFSIIVENSEDPVRSQLIRICSVVVWFFFEKRGKFWVQQDKGYCVNW